MRDLDRRSLLEASLLGTALALPALGAEAAPAHQDWIIDDTSAVADTQSGKVMGYVRGGIRIFKGIPYGQILKGEDRWVRAPKVTPWAGKRSARAAGPSCPGQDIMSPVDEVNLRDSDLLLTASGEDCLRMNVWTPGVDHKKRQVLVYIHGGGWAATSAICSARYEAHNLARHGDVVVVSMNHRINVWGFLDLAAHGGRWAESTNLGMLDLVDALKWVKANIANFGGDPDKVMIFGHSGGGGKVLTLLAMPEAKGLFHRAVAQSPGVLPLATPEQSAILSADFLKRVGVSPNNLDALYKLSTEELRRPAVAINLAFSRAHRRFATGGTERARALSVKMTDAWLAFARSGNPATPALPGWAPVTASQVPAMIFDNHCHAAPARDLAAVEMFWKARFPDA